MISAQIPVASIVSFGPSGVLGVLGAALLVAIAAFVARRAYRETEPALADGPRRLLTSLRFVALLVLIAMIAEPVLHRSREVVTPPGVVVLVDESASMSIAGTDGVSRAERARAVTGAAVDRLTERLEDVRVWVESGSRRVEVSTETGRGALSTGRPDGVEGTDLAGLVLSSAQRHVEDNLAAILLISDGRSTTDRAPALAGLDVPVWTVAVGDSVGPPDIRLDRVRYPSFVNQGDRVLIEAEVVADGDVQGEARVDLMSDGVTLQSATVSWPQDGGRVPVQFEVEGDSLGVRRLEVLVEPGPGEVVDRNNRVQVGFEVGKDRLRVLHVERRPSWNTHFLARHASRDRRIDWTSVHNSASGLRVAGTDSVLTWPMARTDVRDVDLFVAGSLDDAAFLLSEGTGVVESIRAGAGLVVLAGDGGSSTRLSAEAARLLPLRPTLRSRWTGGEIRPEATAAGRIHPIMAVRTDDGDLDTWMRLAPPLRAALLPLETAPDADVLLRGVANRFSVPLLGIRQEGEGRIAAFTGAPLWSWSFWRLGDDEPEPFFRAWFGNLVAFLAEGGGRERLRLQLPGRVVAQGDDVELRAVALDVQLRPDEASDVWLEWGADTGDSTAALDVAGRVRMRPDPRTPGGRRLELPALPPGGYAVRVSMEEGGEAFHSEWQSLTVDPYSVEFRDPAVDRGALAALAARTGGRSLPASDVDAWAAELPLDERRTVLAGRLDLWAGLWLLVPLLLLLGIEWALRKRWGLI